jgi:hypothetical protein
MRTKLHTPEGIRRLSSRTCPNARGKTGQISSARNVVCAAANFFFFLVRRNGSEFAPSSDGKLLASAKLVGGGGAKSSGIRPQGGTISSHGVVLFVATIVGASLVAASAMAFKSDRGVPPTLGRVCVLAVPGIYGRMSERRKSQEANQTRPSFMNVAATWALPGNGFSGTDREHFPSHGCAAPTFRKRCQEPFSCFISPMMSSSAK